MRWALIASLAFFLTGSLPPSENPAGPSGAAPDVKVAAHTASKDADAEAERQLFDLANQARAQAGLPPLQADDGLTQAARTHADAMAAKEQISHQFSGEPSLTQRLAADSTLHLDHAGENVAVSETVDQAQRALMNSPPHRGNLLNAAYNVGGFGVVRSGNALYVVQDFGHSLPKYSAQNSADLVAANIVRLRSQTHLPALQRADGNSAQATACSMAQANSLHVDAPQAHYALRYTSMEPGNLPANANKIVADRGVRTFSVGACYARSASYPSGAYWIALLFN